MTSEDLLSDLNDPATPPDVLERWWRAFPYPAQKPGYHGSHAIRRRIAAHPNLTPKLAGRALGKYPEVVCENPVFPLLKLETPHLVKLVPPSDLLAWLKREHCPAPFVELMLGKNWPLISEAAKRHVSYAGYVSRDGLPNVLRVELIAMPKAKDDWPVDVFATDSTGEAIMKLARYRWEDRGTLLEVLALANIPMDQKFDLWYARAVNWRRRLGVALNPRTPPDLLELLSHDGNRLVNAAARAQLETPGVRLLELL